MRLWLIVLLAAPLIYAAPVVRRWISLRNDGQEVAYKLAPDAGWVYVGDAGPADALAVCEDVLVQEHGLFKQYERYKTRECVATDGGAGFRCSP